MIRLQKMSTIIYCKENNQLNTKQSQSLAMTNVRFIDVITDD